jgi:hypothetical protein
MIKFIVATNQPFSIADEDTFRDLLTYTHHSKQGLVIPHVHGVKLHVMDMGIDMIEGLSKEFEEMWNA